MNKAVAAIPAIIAGAILLIIFGYICWAVGLHDGVADECQVMQASTYSILHYISN